MSSSSSSSSSSLWGSFDLSSSLEFIDTTIIIIIRIIIAIPTPINIEINFLFLNKESFLFKFVNSELNSSSLIGSSSSIFILYTYKNNYFNKILN